MVFDRQRDFILLLIQRKGKVILQIKTMLFDCLIQRRGEVILQLRVALRAMISAQRLLHSACRLLSSACRLWRSASIWSGLRP